MKTDHLSVTLTSLSEATAAAVTAEWPATAAWAATVAATLPEALRDEVVTVADACAADPVIEDGVHERVTTVATSHVPGWLSALRDRDEAGYAALVAAAGAPRKADPDEVSTLVLAHPLLSSFVVQPALRTWREQANQTALADLALA